MAILVLILCSSLPIQVCKHCQLIKGGAVSTCCCCLPDPCFAHIFWPLTLFSIDQMGNSHHMLSSVVLTPPPPPLVSQRPLLPPIPWLTVFWALSSFISAANASVTCVYFNVNSFWTDIHVCSWYSASDLDSYYTVAVNHQQTTFLALPTQAHQQFTPSVALLTHTRQSWVISLTTSAQTLSSSNLNIFQWIPFWASQTQTFAATLTSPNALTIAQSSLQNQRPLLTDQSVQTHPPPPKKVTFHDNFAIPSISSSRRDEGDLPPSNSTKDDDNDDIQKDISFIRKDTNALPDAYLSVPNRGANAISIFFFFKVPSLQSQKRCDSSVYLASFFWFYIHLCMQSNMNFAHFFSARLKIGCSVKIFFRNLSVSWWLTSMHTTTK